MISHGSGCYTSLTVILAILHSIHEGSLKKYTETRNVPIAACGCMQYACIKCTKAEEANRIHG